MNRLISDAHDQRHTRIPVAAKEIYDIGGEVPRWPYSEVHGGKYRGGLRSDCREHRPAPIPTRGRRPVDLGTVKRPLNAVLLDDATSVALRRVTNLAEQASFHALGELNWKARVEQARTDVGLVDCGRESETEAHSEIGPRPRWTRVARSSLRGKIFGAPLCSLPSCDELVQARGVCDLDARPRDTLETCPSRVMHGVAVSGSTRTTAETRSSPTSHTLCSYRAMGRRPASTWSSQSPGSVAGAAMPGSYHSPSARRARRRRHSHRLGWRARTRSLERAPPSFAYPPRPVHPPSPPRSGPPHQHREEAPEVLDLYLVPTDIEDRVHGLTLSAVRRGDTERYRGPAVAGLAVRRPQSHNCLGYSARFLVAEELVNRVEAKAIAPFSPGIVTKSRPVAGAYMHSIAISSCMPTPSNREQQRIRPPKVTVRQGERARLRRSAANERPPRAIVGSIDHGGVARCCLIFSDCPPWTSIPPGRAAAKT